MCGAERPTTAQCGHTFPVMLTPSVVPLLEVGEPFFFREFICSYRQLISFTCAATVFTEIAKIADNSASGPPFANACIAEVAILSRYHSIESSILFDSGAGT